MNYHVVWPPGPFETMGQIIRDYPDHLGLLAQALRDLTATLRANPADAGESRPGGTRIEFFHPLGVRYRVYEADREVHVVSIHLTTLLP